jgi:phage major head subunit gpT-like protein
MISGNVPSHLLVAARTGFLTALKMPEMPWTRIANQLNMDAKSIDLVDLGAAPMPVQDKGGQVTQDFIEKTLTVKPIDWTLKVWISYNAVQDDQTGTLNNRVRGAGVNFQKHINNLVFKTLNGGDGATYGLCYDGQYFFDTDHVDKGAAYQTNQSNVNALTLSLDNFNTVNVAAQKYYDDQGEFCNYAGDLLVVAPELEYVAAQICQNPTAYDTGNREMNPFSGKRSYIVSPQMDSTAWALIDSQESTKPLIVVIREQPNLQSSWFDAEQPDGGRYYFKFFARYNVYYGDWRLATMGNT